MGRREFEQKGRPAGQVISISDVELLDISTEGVRFRTHRRLSPNSDCTFVLGMNGKRNAVKGTVTKSILRGTKRVENDYLPVYEVALEFTDRKVSKGELELLINELSQEKLTIK